MGRTSDGGICRPSSNALRISEVRRNRCTGGYSLRTVPRNVLLFRDVPGRRPHPACDGAVRLGVGRTRPHAHRVPRRFLSFGCAPGMSRRLCLHRMYTRLIVLFVLNGGLFTSGTDKDRVVWVFGGV